MSTNKATLTVNVDGDTRTAEFDVLSPAKGKEVVDINGLAEKVGVFTHDPGFTATSSCESKITYIDGQKGELLYRGYPIEQLAKKAKYLDVAYLLYNGEMPSDNESAEFAKSILSNASLNEKSSQVFEGFNVAAHPMAILMSVVGSLAGFYPDSKSIEEPDARKLAAHRLIAKMPVIAACAHKNSIGEPLVPVDNSLGYVENFLNMMFAKPGCDYQADELAVKAMDTLFTLHADHEQNASTSTVRLVGSTGVNPYAAVASGVAALWGPAHGGANEAVLRMLDEIGDVSNVSKYIAKAKDKSDSFRLMGFGHRVYRNFDPRATIIRELCHEVMSKYGDDPRLELAMKLEEIALQDHYFVERKLYPNVDFYSGIIYSALNIPVEMFTVMFAVARTSGWVSHWNEMISNGYKIGRPRQLYVGHSERCL